MQPKSHLPFDGFYIRKLRNDMDYYSYLPTSKGWKAELAWLADPQRTLYPRSGHMSTIDQAEIRESPPAKDRSPNH